MSYDVDFRWFSLCINRKLHGIKDEGQRAAKRSLDGEDRVSSPSKKSKGAATSLEQPENDVEDVQGGEHSKEKSKMEKSLSAKKKKDVKHASGGLDSPNAEPNIQMKGSETDSIKKEETPQAENQVKSPVFSPVSSKTRRKSKLHASVLEDQKNIHSDTPKQKKAASDAMNGEGQEPSDDGVKKSPGNTPIALKTRRKSRLLNSSDAVTPSSATPVKTPKSKKKKQ